MISFLGYNFCSDGNCIDPVPTSIDNITSTQLSNGIFDHWYLTSNTSEPYPTTIPDQWDYDTIMDADFNGNVSAGNVDFTLAQITGFKIKRRIVGTFDWITLVELPVATLEDLKVSFNDNLNSNFIDYEYALVPMMNNIEGDYITNEIISQFDGVFICDLDTVYKFYAGVEYGEGTRVQKVGVFEPMGRATPIVVSNALTNYETGNVRGTVLPSDYGETGTYQPLPLVQERKELLDFLTNKKAKVLKDWAGNSWLMMVIDMPTISYKTGSGMALADVGFNYVTLGDSNNQTDLYNSGIVEEAD